MALPIQMLLSLSREDPELKWILGASEVGRFKSLVGKFKGKESHLRAE